MIDAAGGGSLWSFLDTYRNPPLNELFIDYLSTDGGDPRPAVVAREKPFVNVDAGRNSPWFDLPEHIIPAWEIESISVRQGANRINFIMCYGEVVPFMPNEPYAIHKPLFHPESVERHGLRKMEERTAYLHVEATRVEDAQSWRDLILGWSVLQHEYWSGSIMLRDVRPEIRVGTRVTVQGAPGGWAGLPEKLTFYVEGVTQSVMEGRQPSSATSLQLTRGYVDADRVNAVKDATSKWTEV
jgi:hypothetical protein